MSRVANSPVAVPKGVDINIDGANISVKGGKGSLDLMLTNGIGVSVAEDVATITYDNDDCRAMAGTTRSLLANMVKGVSEGWDCLLYTSPSPRDVEESRMPSSA